MFVLAAHIPALSSEEQFLDILYLGIFVILSPAFDARFYFKPPPSLVNEVGYAIRHFHSLILFFSLQFVIFLGGESVAVSYVVHRVLAEFAAAAVVFARGVQAPLGEGNGVGGIKDGISFPMFLASIESILQDYCPDILPFFSSRTESCHKHFLWTGPNLQILPRSQDAISFIQLTTKGELLDFPGCPIYPIVDESSGPIPAVGKRPSPGDSMDIADKQPKKRKC